jgi:hypothetical protein
MLRLEKIDDVCAIRKLFLLTDPSVEIHVLIGIPQLFLDTADYYCPVQIQGIGTEKVDFAVGIDAVQAMQLAFRLLGSMLAKLNNAYNGALRWEGDTKGDLGFPKP